MVLPSGCPPRVHRTGQHRQEEWPFCCSSPSSATSPAVPFASSSGCSLGERLISLRGTAGGRGAHVRIASPANAQCTPCTATAWLHVTCAHAGSYHRNNAGHREGDDVSNNQPSMISLDLVIFQDRSDYESVLHKGQLRRLHQHKWVSE